MRDYEGPKIDVAVSQLHCSRFALKAKRLLLSFRSTSRPHDA